MIKATFGITQEPFVRSNPALLSQQQYRRLLPELTNQLLKHLLESMDYLLKRMN